jgi:hypothetical protein
LQGKFNFEHWAYSFVLKKVRLEGFLTLAVRRIWEAWA